MYIIGRGGFGKVWKVQKKQNNTLYAMKEMSKSKIVFKNSTLSVMNERRILASIHHPFIINITCSFQDKENLYLVMDYMGGGDLRYHLGRRRKFSENHTRTLITRVLRQLHHTRPRVSP
jgi:serine/threonine protein kinase